MTDRIRILQRPLPLLLAFLTGSFLFSGSAAGRNPEAVQLPEKERFHLFLLVGQSNMAGRGRIDPADNAPHPRVLMFTKQQQWVPAIDPLHFDKPKVVGVGLGRTFAEEVAAAHPGVTIGLIPCAVGGSPVAAWEPGAYYPPTKSHPWDDALKRARRAMQDGTLKGILWHQGESDSKAELAERYESRLHELINRFREQLDAPGVPFLVGQMGQFEERPWDAPKRQVDAAHRSLPETIEQTAFVDSNGLSHNGDEVHFSTEAYRELGRRYANAYLQLTQTGDNLQSNPGPQPN